MTGVLLIFAYLGGWTRLIADDYCSVYYARSLGFLDSIILSYRTINGRYAAYGTDWVVLNIFDAEHIRFVPQIVLFLWFVFFLVNLYWVFKLEKIAQQRFFWAVAFSLAALYLILILSPNIPQSLYWWNGMRSYGLPLVVLTANGGMIYFFLRNTETKIQTFGGVLFGFLVFFANGGLSETYLVLQISFFLFLLFDRFFLQKTRGIKKYLFLIAGLFGSLASLALILHSYANVIRRSVMPAAPNIQMLLRISLESYLLFLGELFARSEIVFAVAGALALAFWFGLNAQKKTKKPFWQIGLYFLTGFGFLFASFVPGVYGYVKFPPTRTLITGVFFWVIFLLYAGFLLGNRFSRRDMQAKAKWATVLVASFLLCFSAATTARSLYKSKEIYLDFAEKWDRVDAEILRAKALGAEEITIPGMDNWAKLDRPNENPKFWATRCYSLYYDIQVYGPPY